MNCLRCNTENDEAAKFCKNCGFDLTYSPTNNGANNNKYQTLLIVIGLFIVFETFIWTTYRLFFIDYWKPIRYFSLAMSILFNFIPIIIGIIVNNKTAKILLIVLGAIVLIASIYSQIKWW